MQSNVPPIIPGGTRDAHHIDATATATPAIRPLPPAVIIQMAYSEIAEEWADLLFWCEDLSNATQLTYALLNAPAERREQAEHWLMVVKDMHPTLRSIGQTCPIRLSDRQNITETDDLNKKAAQLQRGRVFSGRVVLRFFHSAASFLRGQSLNNGN
jgi:hypothetical protein